MKKRAFIIAITIFLILIIGVILYMTLFNQAEKIDAFNILDYSTYIDEFPSDKVVGQINSAKVAKEKAEDIWVQIYGEAIKDKRPYTVLFDEKTQVWLVKGNLKKQYTGGVPYILIQKSDGKVLAIWHDK